MKEAKLLVGFKPFLQIIKDKGDEILSKYVFSITSIGIKIVSTKGILVTHKKFQTWLMCTGEISKEITYEFALFPNTT